MVSAMRPLLTNLRLGMGGGERHGRADRNKVGKLRVQRIALSAKSLKQQISQWSTRLRAC